MLKRYAVLIINYNFILAYDSKAQIVCHPSSRNKLFDTLTLPYTTLNGLLKYHYVRLHRNLFRD